MTPENEKEFVALVKSGALPDRATFKMTMVNLNALRKYKEIK
jgi:hypothetical protein